MSATAEGRRAHDRAAADHLAALEDQRDFLLRSLEDLEREHAAGDVDAGDYAALKDDYTARAATVLRAIQAGRARAARSARRSGRGRTVLVVAGVVVFAVLAGVLVARNAGRRDAGDVVTGDVRQSLTEKLNEASRRGNQGDYEAAVELYDEVLAEDPDSAEALTYKGWMLTLSGATDEGLDVLLAAATAHPEFPDVHAFLAVVFFRSGLVEPADRELDRLEALDPPPMISQLTEGLRARIDAALAQASTTTTTTSPSS